MAKRKTKGWKLKLLLVLLGLLLGALGLEGLLRLRPTLLPMDLRAGYPLRGIEFLHPGVLGEMPVDELWVPLVSAAWDGTPPADLKQYGIAPMESDWDARRFPRAHTPVDALGLPNPSVPDAVDVVLVGDSLLLAASSSSPPGLVSELARRSGLSTYSLGVPGIGPQHEASLLEKVGLPLRPKLVLWFFFGGNDLNDAKQVLAQQAAGKRVRSELDGYRSIPVSYLYSLLHWNLMRPGTALVENEREPLPAFQLGGRGSESTPMWLHPSYLARTTLKRSQWEAHVAWGASTQAIDQSRKLAEAQGARFVLVYLPSKAEALLPALAGQAELLLRTLKFDLGAELPETAEEALQKMLANRGSLAQALEAHCRAEGIPFFSASEALERQALAGQAGYFATDTHWMPAGQNVVLDALLSFLAAKGLVAH